MAKDETEEHLLPSHSFDPEADLQRREAQLAAAQRKFRWVQLSSFGLFGLAFCLFAGTWLIQLSGSRFGGSECSELQCSKKISPYCKVYAGKPKSGKVSLPLTM